MAKSILVVDDEKRILSLLKAYLEQQGFSVVTAANGQDALYLARQQKPDLIILDVLMPEMDGYEFMRQHRKERETPIILLTAKVEEDDKVIGLELGADDYITKPFSPRELTSRVRAVLRRTGQGLPQIDILRQGGVTLDRNNHLVKVDEEVVDLTPSEFDLLAALMAAPGRTFTRLELLDQIQDTAFAGYARTIDVHIKNLRAKIEMDPRQPRYIETVYGLGYRWTAR
ncbi:MAG: response regulator transcription factor [Anaerolineales bacterium]|jgi:DNA-binding response OmpR family regulator